MVHATFESVLSRSAGGLHVTSPVLSSRATVCELADVSRPGSHLTLISLRLFAPPSPRDSKLLSVHAPHGARCRGSHTQVIGCGWKHHRFHKGGASRVCGLRVAAH